MTGNCVHPWVHTASTEFCLPRRRILLPTEIRIQMYIYIYIYIYIIRQPFKGARRVRCFYAGFCIYICIYASKNVRKLESRWGSVDLEACRETEDKNILGKLVGYKIGGGWRQGANSGAKVLLGSPKRLKQRLEII